MKIKKGDLVKILSGDDRGKTAKVLRAFPTNNKVLVEGINTIKRHQKPTREGQKGTIIEKPMPVHVSNVALVDAVKSKPAKIAKK
ncbi:MAG: 50S ribosomal protein L24 [Candidatus Taylorbacteria bacterium]